MNIRTDLVSEENVTDIPEVNCKTKTENGIEIEITEIKSDAAAARIGKPKGKYCTLRFPRLDTLTDTEPLKDAVVFALGELSGGKNNNAMIVGLGNADITPDALGPLCAGAVIATRHISDELKHTFGLDGLNTVSCIVPGVLGKTGIEAVDIIKATAEETKPDIILAIDALAARAPENLCRTIQMTDSGIAPGSGVKNERKELSRDTLGVPVIAIGVPTVIDANSIIPDFYTDENMMVTPKEIDLLVARAADVTARAINRFFQPSLSEETIESLS
ncbi:MAG: GPR endopeptidase [Clostridia bacterium]|nr:GPR endopeptidase [Clostridia bacterium]